jgi:anti-sigma B factor antagonist
MEINIGMDGDVVILDLTGDLVASTVEDFNTQTMKLIDKNFVYILLEISNVNFMDSSGLGACIALHKAVTEKNGMVVFAKPSDSVSKIFRITRADQRLNVRVSKTEGIQLLNEKIISNRRQK